jgi:FKBP-type peptidyl-prolyl cis-trans isomerase FkpA
MFRIIMTLGRHALLASCFLGAPLLFAGCGSTATTTSPTSADTVPYSQTDLVLGKGTIAFTGKTATVDYTGWLYDASAPDHKGTQFDTSIGRGPLVFVLGSGAVVAGFDRGVTSMQVGGQRRLIIPPSLGYGATGNGAVPPNATLVFDVTLENVS